MKEGSPTERGSFFCTVRAYRVCFLLPCCDTDLLQISALRCLFLPSVYADQHSDIQDQQYRCCKDRRNDRGRDPVGIVCIIHPPLNLLVRRDTVRTDEKPLCIVP